MSETLDPDEIARHERKEAGPRDDVRSLAVLQDEVLAAMNGMTPRDGGFEANRQAWAASFRVNARRAATLVMGT